MLIDNGHGFTSKHTIKVDPVKAGAFFGRLPSPGILTVRITLTDGTIPDGDDPTKRARYAVRVFREGRVVHTDTRYAPRVSLHAIDSRKALRAVAETSVRVMCMLDAEAAAKEAFAVEVEKRTLHAFTRLHLDVIQQKARAATSRPRAHLTDDECRQWVLNDFDLYTMARQWGCNV